MSIDISKSCQLGKLAKNVVIVVVFVDDDNNEYGFLFILFNKFKIWLHISET